MKRRRFPEAVLLPLPVSVPSNRTAQVSPRLACWSADLGETNRDAALFIEGEGTCQKRNGANERLPFSGSALHFVALRHMPAVKSDAARSGCTILVHRYISLHGVTCLP